MEQVYLGRVRGSGIFLAVDVESAVTVDSSCLIPAVLPLDGDSIIFSNGDVRSVLSVSGTTVLCSDVYINVKGTKGDEGVSISKVEQTTASTADGGTNVITVTLSNGQTFAFNVKNGSKGNTGDTGATGVSITSATITAV